MTTEEIANLISANDKRKRRPVKLDGIYYPSMYAAAMAINVTHQAIRAAINDNRKCKGHTVEWA